MFCIFLKARKGFPCLLFWIVLNFYRAVFHWKLHQMVMCYYMTLRLRGTVSDFYGAVSEQLTAAHNHGAGVCVNASVLSVSWWACLCPIPGVLWRLHMIGHTVAAHKCPGLAGVGWRGSKGERRGLESDGLPGSQVCSN